MVYNHGQNGLNKSEKPHKNLQQQKTLMSELFFTTAVVNIYVRKEDWATH